MSETVHKILTFAEWNHLQSTGRFDGSPDDLRDGFIHLSTTEQLSGTLQKHFAGQTGLVCVSFQVSHLGPALRWEPSRGGQLFPHLYGPLLRAAVSSHEPCSPVPPVSPAEPAYPA
jgi:uncharacterized protein (DUF952 family)